jgi:DNA-binding beta-propeller fold protein YncE
VSLRAGVALLAILGLPGALGAGGAEQKAAVTQRGRAVERGIAVDLTVVPAAGGQAPAAELREGQEAVIRFRLSDEATGTPLAGASPAAWLEAAAAARTAGTCSETVAQLLSGSFFRRPAVDLNAYHVLALNDEASVAVIDPLSGFGGSKLLAQVKLASPGEDWALSADRARLYVSQPAAGKVAAVDTADWKVVAQIDAGPRPGRLALEPDGGRLWVSTATGVAAIDTASLKTVAQFTVGSSTAADGPRRDLVLSDDGRRLFAVEAEAQALAEIDTARLAKLREVVLPEAPTSVAWSPLGHAAYAVAGEAGKVFVVDPEALRIRATASAEPGLGALRFAPGGRFGIAADAAARRVHVFDVASNRFVQSGEVPGVPEQVSFSDTLAYVRQRESDSVLMITLASVGEEKHALSVADFPGGEHPPGAGRPRDLSTRPDVIVRSPEPGAMLVANAADGAIYYYREGMAAPMGSFQDYGGHPRAVLVVDRSLKERSPGSYETVARLSAPGRYRLAFFLDTPRTVQCFDVTVAADPVLAAQRLRELPFEVTPQIESRTVTAGRAAHLRFRITDPATHLPVDGLSDVHVMAFLSSGSWQSRMLASSVGDGIYEADFVPPGAGSYHLAVECFSGRVAFNRSPQVVLRAVD